MPTEPDSPEGTSIASDVAPIPPAPTEEKKSQESAKPSTPAAAGDAESPAGPPPPSPIATLQAERDGGGPRAADPYSESQQSTQERADASAEGALPDESGAAGTEKTRAPQDGSGSTNTAEQNPPLGPDGVPLQEATFVYWMSLDEDARKACYDVIDLYFHNLLEDFRVNANAAVKRYGQFGRRNNGWRLMLIIATGGLAIVNVLAANDATKQWTLFGMQLSLAAAVYAASLALLTNLESFLNYTDKKSSTRESRELYLDAYRQFEMLRVTQVYPYGYSAQACFNFNEIYRRLVVKDLELRRKIMQLSTSRTGLGKQ